jgi:hypothetical protein
MIVANFTPDPIFWMHGGKDGTLKPGDIADMPDNRARHILNKFDRRGVIILNFGDDPEVRRKEAMQTWTNFWMRQVTVFNQDNERRKNTNREYVDPTDDLRDHALKLGLELVGPWSIKQTDNEMMRNVLNQNASLQSQVEMLMKQVSALTEAMKSRDVPFELRTAAEKIELSKRGAESQPEKVEEPQVKQPPTPDEVALMKEFNKLDKERFGEWVMRNLDRLQSTEFPPAIRTIVKEKWERLIKGEFPIPE